MKCPQHKDLGIRAREEVTHPVLYVCHTPRTSLNAFVECMWLVEGESCPRSSRSSIVPTNADPPELFEPVAESDEHTM
jgi:hypothetical protein